jgi:predicted Zn-dependent protease with MMP-like domain
MSFNRYYIRMEDKQFTRLVLDAIAHVPEDIRELMVNAVVVVEAEPSRSLLHDMGIGRGGTLLGLYQGVPIDRRGFSYGNTLPDKITIFKGPILRECDTPEEIEALVIEVVIHEVGHYFGLDDDEMAEYEGYYYDEWE